jgi:hypothetical protein
MIIFAKIWKNSANWKKNANNKKFVKILKSQFLLKKVL